MPHSDPYDRVKGRGWVEMGEGAVEAQRSDASPCPSAAPRLLPAPEGDGPGGPIDPVFTADLKLRFLDELSRHGNVRVAAARVGVSRSGAYLARRRDGAFAAGWSAALRLARQHGEAVLAERALEGVEEPVYYRGELIAVRRRFDSRLLLAHLARLDALCGDDGDDCGAGAFDAALGAVAGLAEAAALPDAPRGDHVEAAGEAAGHWFDCTVDEPDPQDPAAFDPDAPFAECLSADPAEAARLAQLDAAYDRLADARAARVAAARAAAGAAWDRAHRALYRAVDGLLGPAEFKSLGGCAGASNGKARGSTFAAPDLVHCVHSPLIRPEASAPRSGPGASRRCRTGSRSWSSA